MSLVKSGDYTLSRNQTTDNDVIAIQVKLTDSCLDALDAYLKLSSKLPGHHPTLSCNGKAGRMFIPDQNGGKDFQFLCTTLQEDQGPFECYSLHNSRSHQMLYEGSITTKMSIQATDESYAKTKIKMERAEEERKESRAKLVNPVSKAKGARGKPKTTPIRPTRPLIPPSKPQLPARKTNYVTTPSNKSYKDRVIHYLANKPLNKLQLLTRLHKDGQAHKKDKNALGSILKEVAVMRDNKFYLHKNLYSEIQVDKFPYYTESEKRQVISNISKYYSKDSVNSVHISESSSNTRNPPSKHEKNVTSSNTTKTIHPHSTSSRNSSHGNNAQHSSPVTRKKRNVRETEIDNSIKQLEKKSKQDNILANSSSINEKSNESDYRTLYPTIKLVEERDHYKSIFNKGFAEYTRLKERYSDIADLFREKQKQLESIPENSSKYREITDEIVRKYEEIIQKRSYNDDKRKLSSLYSKLSHLKKQIEEFQKK